MQRPHARPAVARRVASAPVDLDRLRSAATTRRTARPLTSTRALDALRRHIDAIARGEASVSPALSQRIRPR